MNEKQKSSPTSATATPPISGLVPMIQVADVERSAQFYRLLGFEIGNRQPREGRMGWAWLYGPKVEDWRRGPNLMLLASDHPLEPDKQQAIFYLYAANLVALRKELLAAGVNVGDICYPEYLPKGEFRTQDPDGYVLMLAQSFSETP